MPEAAFYSVDCFGAKDYQPKIGFEARHFQWNYSRLWSNL